MSAEPNERRRGRGFDPVPKDAGLATRMVQGARRAELNAGAVVPPIYPSTTYHFPGEFSESKGTGVYMYTRLENPTQEVAAELLREAEGAEEARVFASGMGAISTTLLGLVESGSTVVALEELYGGTTDLLRDLLPRFGVRVRFVGPREALEPETAVGERANVVLVESPTNPLLGVHDLGRWARAAHQAGALLLVDNTFATPVNQNPLALGADLVLHSATKYLGGHSDVTAGAVAGRSELVRRLDHVHSVLGAPLDPFGAFLLARGMRTLPVRVARHNENGRALVEAVERHRAVERVFYPGRRGAEEEKVAAGQMRGRGGMVTLELRGGLPAARRFLAGLRTVHVAASLGGVESLVSLPIETSHRHLPEADRRRLGISEGLARLSLGIEDAADLEEDVTRALDGL